MVNSKDRKAVLKAVRRSNSAYEHIDEKFKKDKEILLDAIKFGTPSSHMISTFKEAVGNPIEHADEKLKDDVEIIWEGIKKNMSCLSCASNRIRKNRSFVSTV